MLNMSSVAVFLGIFRWIFHIPLKNTSGWVLLIRKHSKKILVEVNPFQSWPWKQNGTTVVAAVMILEVENNWRSVLQINILKKSYSLNSNHVPLQKMYVTITILEWLASTWCIYLTEIPKENLKLSDHLNQT